MNTQAMKQHAMTKAAVFIDKDGTLIPDVPYNVDPAKIGLRPKAGMALRRLQNAGYELVLISNQSGVALGRFEESALNPVWASLRAQLAGERVDLSAIYYCPHHPAGEIPQYAAECECRKPRPGLLQRAAQERRIDLQRSWMLGDILDDVEAGRRAGCRTVLLDVGSETEWRESPLRTPDFMARDLDAASHYILASTP